MTASAYHLFNELYCRRNSLKLQAPRVEQFMFSDNLVAFRGSRGTFPDLILRANPGDALFPGGEFIEIKETKSYTIASFNSTMPGAHKNASECIPLNGRIYREMKQNGEEPHQPETREVYYLIRARKDSKCKVCLVAGAFFETMPAAENLRAALKEALADAMQDSKVADASAAEASIARVLQFNWKREHLAKVRKDESASVSIRMRVMAEVLAEANILDAKKYPAIGDDTLNMVVPASGGGKNAAVEKMESAFQCKPGALPADLRASTLTHLRDGAFVLFQAGI